MNDSLLVLINYTQVLLAQAADLEEATVLVGRVHHVDEPSREGSLPHRSVLVTIEVVQRQSADEQVPDGLVDSRLHLIVVQDDGGTDHVEHAVLDRLWELHRARGDVQ